MWQCDKMLSRSSVYRRLLFLITFRDDQGGMGHPSRGRVTVMAFFKSSPAAL